MEKKVDIFLIFVLNVLQVQKAIPYHLPCEQEIQVREIMMSDAYLRGDYRMVFMFVGKEGLARFKNAVDQCTQYGECVERCPYQLAIPDLMPGKVRFFEEIWMEHFEK
jgi:hypothetical protein